MRILFLGDTHGNAEFLRAYIYPLAKTVEAEAIIQLGDFGAWEHVSSGVHFMNEISWLGQQTGIPLYWLHGNHDKHSHTLAHYPRDQRGFYRCREFVYYIPQGHAWKAGGVRLRAFGGAYSVDKDYRLSLEAKRGESETLWFPEEEMTDAEMTRLLAADNDIKDIVLSHDKPFSALPGGNRKNLPGCVPNQMRLERALRVHQPLYWFHGHLHAHYVDTVYGPTYRTTIVGLAPDWDAAEPNYRRVHSWAIVDCAQGKADIRLGTETYVEPELFQQNVDALN